MRLLAFGTMVGALGWLAVSCAAEEGGGKDDGDGGADPGAETQGLCADACPKPCQGDTDCETQNGELCCDFGDGVGKACSSAASCPRFCAGDVECDTAAGEACLRTHVVSEQTVCTSPEAALHACQLDTDCGLGERCCGIYGAPICVPAASCPAACSVHEECDASLGQICCTTFGLVDPSLAVAGLCVNPALTPCPSPCSQSSECNTAAGELCCNGVCNTSCPKACDSSDQCTGQICCKTAAAQSVWMGGGVTPPIYQVGDPADACPLAQNGSCDEPGGCPAGTDTTDCANSCIYAFDGYCDEGSYCPPGTDTADCGAAGSCDALFECACEGPCFSECLSMCQTGEVDEACMSCAQAVCPAAFQECLSSQ
jgi:hypothetical protein